MTYNVRWSRRSLDVLAEIWVDSSSEERAAITQTSAAVDRLLQSNPHEQGESRSADRRVLIALPLILTYSIDEPRRIVRVLNVRQMRRRATE